MTKPADLAALRAELDELDHELLRVARRRLEVVAQVKAAKAATGKHLFDRQREQVVFRRAETSGQALGLDPGLARDLIARLVEASHTVQEGRAPAETAGDARRLLIIGGRGKMGAMLGHQFAARGHSVEVIEKDEALDRGKVEKADIVMIAVPMQVAVAVTKAVAPLVRTDALLCDINSLKTDVCRALATSRGEALGMHPMFGPTVASLRRQKVVLCEVKSGPHSAWLAAQWGRLGAEVIKTTPEHHDAMMSVVQVLTHFGIMAMGRALQASGYALESTLPYTSPIYRLELAMVGRLFSQKPELYREIMLSNPVGATVRKAFLAEAQALHELIEAGDAEGFVRAFEEVSRYFADFSQEAMDVSDQIISMLVARP